MLFTGQAVTSSSNPTQCQSSASPEFSGKVAVIDRGNCPFADKICNAQLQGATAAIVVNNVDGGVFTMGGYSSYVMFRVIFSRVVSHSCRLCTISIPSVMISKADGSTLKARLPVTVSADKKGSPTCDGCSRVVHKHELPHVPPGTTVPTTSPSSPPSAPLLTAE
jgi:hypothetical protein